MTFLIYLFCTLLLGFNCFCHCRRIKYNWRKSFDLNVIGYMSMRHRPRLDLISKMLNEQQHHPSFVCFKVCKITTTKPVLLPHCIKEEEGLFCEKIYLMCSNCKRWQHAAAKKAPLISANLNLKSYCFFLWIWAV